MVRIFYAGLSTYITVLIAVLLAVLLAGCDLPSYSGNSYVSESAEDYAQMQFFDVQDCTQLYEGSRDDIVLIFKEPNFPCDWYADGCQGLFSSTDMSVQIASWDVLRHEFIHYLLYVATGNADPGHTRPEWTCQ